MRAIIIGLVVVAIVLAGGTAYLLRDYLSSMQAELESQKPVAPTTRILVAASDMPVGTVINANNTEWLKWPKDEVPEGFIEDNPDDNPLDKIVEEKHLARRGFVKGQPISMDLLYQSDDPGFLRGALSPGMRAVSVRTAADNASSGFILPGDRVDLLLTHDMLRQIFENVTEKQLMAFNNTSETILTDLRVLAVDQKTSGFEGGAALGKTILLEVTPRQAEMIETAKGMGSLTLVLRSAEEGDDQQETRFTTDVEVSPVLSSLPEIREALDLLNQARTMPTPSATPAAAPAPAPQPAPRPVPRAAPKPDKREITIYRGGQTTGSAPTGAAQ